MVFLGCRERAPERPPEQEGSPDMTTALTPLSDDVAAKARRLAAHARTLQEVLDRPVEPSEAHHVEREASVLNSRCAQASADLARAVAALEKETRAIRNRPVPTR